jgi:hypothetical protein
MGLARQYAIEGRLSGCLIRAEGVFRDRVRLSLDRSGQTLTGDLQTSGVYEGRPSDLILTAKGLVLQRAERAVAYEQSRSEPVKPGGPLAARAPAPR